ncbi:ZIP family metal transporter [Diaphorobacter sp. JS3050]|uniref:ZIP family metal transporter n=1 Tax=Diaphorobacter TaxID=238749 RepID=UPI001552E273|nr:MULTISPECIES: ZIP family metal transporter [unclassified Diaphorobacter]QJY34090.1 ZIP family metal transporter [Diaphorobacter sp. JS3050]QPN32339.1 ZIP family metal transporter [Diaphorobacter sp. JS3051]QYY24844.1 ZIP family metal transporter [Diaphorobacter sp. MNS-0]
MTLIAIILATLAAGIGSVWVAAALLRLGMGTRQRVGPQHLLSLAAGALLATAFMHLLPEAFESQASAHDLFATLLLGLVFFFLLDKAELWHHGHEHSPSERHIHGQGHHDHHPDHAHDHHHGPGQHGHGGWALLTGDSVHCFGDGLLIASAFMADMRLGVVAALSVLAHEVPHHIGDLVVLRHSIRHRNAALLKVSLAGALTALGGLVGYYLVGLWDGGLPYFLAIASSSFVYVALADLIPQLQKRLSAAQTLAQIAWLAAGIAVVTFVSGLAHAH